MKPGRLPRHTTHHRVYAHGLQTTPDQPELSINRPFYGWVMLGVCAVAMIATAPGQTVLVSLFNTSFRESFNLSASGLSAAYLIGTVGAAFPLVLIGTASDRFGPRKVMAAIAVVFGLVCVCMGLVGGIVTLTLAFFLLRFLGQGSLGLVSSHALALWFERRLGSANGLKLVAANLGFAALPPLVIWMISDFGWRTAYAALGIGVIVCVLPLALFVARDHPEQVGQRIDGDPIPTEAQMTSGALSTHTDPAFTLQQAVRTRVYWALVACSVLSGLVGTAILFHIQPLMQARGLDPTLAANVVPAWSLTMTLCIFPAGWLADRIHPSILLPVSVALMGCASLGAMLASSVIEFQTMMATFGLSQALVTGALIPTVARYYGRKHHGAIRGSLTRLNVAGTGLGPVLLGISLDWFGSFSIALIGFAIISIPVTIGAICVRKPVKPAPPDEAVVAGRD